MAVQTPRYQRRPRLVPSGCGPALGAVLAVAVAQLGCASEPAIETCADARDVLASCTDSDQESCADDSPAAQLVATGQCDDDQELADVFGNNELGESCLWNWQCRGDAGFTCIDKACYYPTWAGNTCDPGDDDDCAAGLSCVEDPSEPSRSECVRDADAPELYAETIGENEEEEFRFHVTAITGIIAKVAMSGDNGDGKPRRGFHAKPHGCVKGEFVVREELPEGYEVGGVFQAGNAFPAYARFSNGLSVIQSDAAPDVKGLAIKLVGVPGDKVLEGAARQAVTQDFVMINQPANFAADANEFVEFAIAQNSSTIDFAAYLATHPRQAHFLTLKLPFDVARSVRTETYWGGGAYRWGDKAMRYIARPCAGVEAPVADLFDADYLRDELVGHLQEDEVCFDFYVQLQTNPVSMPIEDASIAWDEDRSRPVRVARLTIDSQDLSSQDSAVAEARCNDLSFTPWHSLPEYRPLGNTNRSRRFVYEASRVMRGGSDEPTE